MSKPFLKLPTCEDGTHLGLIVCDLYSSDEGLDRTTYDSLARALQAHGEEVREACAAVAERFEKQEMSIKEESIKGADEESAARHDHSAFIARVVAGMIGGLDVSVEA